MFPFTKREVYQNSSLNTVSTFRVFAMICLFVFSLWRLRHKNKPGFRRRQRTKLGLVQARLDFWLISVQLEYQVKCVRVAPGKKF